MAPVELIDLAYSLNGNQLTGLPQWAQYSRNSLYSITATTDKPTSRDQMLLMLRRVLAERFQLVLDVSDKIQPVYDLEVAPGGPKLKPRPADEPCPKGIDSDSMKAAGAPPNSMSTFSGCTLTDLVAAFNRPGITRRIGRPVVDKTGLTGRYYMLVWQTYQPDTSYTGPGGRFLSMESFREAVEKELGLMLIKATGLYRRFTVTHIARPAPDN